MQGLVSNISNSYLRSIERSIENELFKACENGNLPLVIKLLKNKNIDVKQVYINGYTPLHVACRKGHIEIVRALLEDGRSDCEQG
jgi:ankyrin repeat protein